MNTRIDLVHHETDIDRCFELMSTLRPGLSRAEFVSAVPRLMATMGYQLVAMEDAGRLVALAVIRIGEWLHTGRYLEIEELVTDAGLRSRGYGHVLLAWLGDYARRQGCRQLRLVSGVARIDAHRFYEREGMAWEAKYFSMDLADTGARPTAAPASG